MTSRRVIRCSLVFSSKNQRQIVGGLRPFRGQTKVQTEWCTTRRAPALRRICVFSIMSPQLLPHNSPNDATRPMKTAPCCYVVLQHHDERCAGRCLIAAERRRPRLCRILAASLLSVALAGCAIGPGRRPSATIPSSVYQHGEAGYYAKSFGTPLTADGETYSPDGLTAAHRSLPFGTRVRVTNLDNGRQVIVRINDRGPYVPGRIIDLSRRAAKQLHMIKDGLVPVTLTIVSEP